MPRGSAIMSESDDDLRLVRRAADGDATAAGEALVRHRDRLRRMVDARLDRRVHGRVDPADVLQDGFADAVAKLPGYLADAKLPLFLWLRLVVGERLAKVHRDHLGAQVRDAGREVSLYRGPMPAASSAALIAHLLGNETSPTQAAVRAERLVRLQEALNSLEPLDRELLSLRHFEELTHTEAARVLDVGEAAAAKRYVRALKKLKDVLNALSDPGGHARGLYE
ncbi:MAG: sigma-70 family RNA polymerase sigma factor [Gemmataceae bacterium]